MNYWKNVPNSEVPDMITNVLMQTSGEVFDVNRMLVDASKGVVYRKELFNMNHGTMQLPEELLVRDKRFTKPEIEMLAQEAGFLVVQSRYVKLGAWDSEASSNDAKEILLILKKA
jgi:hypothetical protein